MTYAVVHIIIAMIIADFIREHLVKDKKKFPVYYVFIAGMAGILPDIDVAAFWILNFFSFSYAEVHRTFTHTLFLPIASLFLALISLNFKNKIGRHNLKPYIIFLMIVIGLFTHLILDATIAGEIKPLYPFNMLTIGLNLENFLPDELQKIFLPSLDAGIFVLWLFWLEYKHKISDFI